MLEQISVSGFRSLRDFALEIKAGLNVLAGPNGAGKTNIILFFDFFRSFATQTLTEAVGEAGGVAQVFSKKGKNKFSEKIVGVLSGRVHRRKEAYAYSLKFEIEFSSTQQDVYFSKQELLVEKLPSKGTSSSSIYAKIVYYSGPDGKPKLDVIEFPGPRKETSWARSQFDELHERKFYSQNCLLAYLRHFDDVSGAIANDLSARFVLNVVPSQVKKPEDSTREPGIDSDGSGLSATLFAIKKGRRVLSSRNVFYIPHRKQPSTPDWSDVIDLIRVAVPSISDVEVENDPFDNLLRCRITIGTGRKKAVLPLGSMSDGTVKWMSLIVRLLTSRDALLLEEPENYLHPLMQKEIVRLLRELIRNSGFTIVSTHSETLLNAVRPEELVLVSYSEQGTKARRVSNSLDVAEEINRTGFGLGYYYLADAVEVSS